MRMRKYRAWIKEKNKLSSIQDQDLDNDKISTDDDMEQYVNHYIPPGNNCSNNSNLINLSDYKNQFENSNSTIEVLATNSTIEATNNVIENEKINEEYIYNNLNKEEECKSPRKEYHDLQEEYYDLHPEIEQLREWAIKYRIAHAHLDPLLGILRSRLLPTLPLSSKTFLKTFNASYHIENMEDGDASMGKFAYIGINQGLKACINVSAHELGIIKLQFNCDGLSLSKSSSRHIWPILCKVHSDLAYYEPFVVALYCGKSKPKNVDNYLKEFINEINELLTKGITISQVHLKIQIHCFIADTPARSFLKGTKGHAGFRACERCHVIGTKIDKTTVFCDIDSHARTDNSFREFSDPDHHNCPSPLLFIDPPINMISSFVLDFMHLAFLGVMAKLLDYWFTNQSRTRISQTAKTEISRRLELLRSQVPKDFQRKLRTLSDFSKYKATELKFFLLYIGPVVLKDILDEVMYKHFLLFHVASRLLWCKKTAKIYV